MTNPGDLIFLWYNRHHRALPWRETNDPYHVWVSEVILQQTRVEQGLGYYQRFIHLFPDIQTLAEADTDQVLRAWQGLGYYRRALNLQRAARIVTENLEGVLPLSWTELRKLPGIGDYTASAIASICAGERRPAIDGNVKRVIARLHNLHLNLDSRAGLELVRTLVLELMEGKDPGLMNNALMEFGALQCTPRSPGCISCPLHEHCLALRAGTVELLPLKQERKEIRKRHFFYYVFTWDENDSLHMLVRKRGYDDIWAGMYEFPCIETVDSEFNHDLFRPATEPWCEVPEGTPVMSRDEPYRHQLTHQLIVARFFHFPLPAAPAWHHPDLIRVSRTEIAALAKPKLILKYLGDSFPGL
ncbi:MAG: A/G-specific adenine glycosylase [Bacteroidales bacterium]